MELGHYYLFLRNICTTISSTVIQTNRLKPGSFWAVVLPGSGIWSDISSMWPDPVALLSTSASDEDNVDTLLPVIANGENPNVSASKYR